MLSGKAKVNGYEGLWDVIIYKAKSFALRNRQGSSIDCPLITL